MSSKGLLVIGNGGAAVSGVRAAREAGYAGPIQMVSDSCGQAFNPMLAPYYLAGEIPFERCFPFGRRFYRDHDVTCHFGTPVAALDAHRKEVRLADGRVLGFDRCLVASGARPVLPKVPGMERSRHVYTLRTSEDTIQLKEALGHARRALILGASLIGLKMAEICLTRGMRVTVVDIATQVLPGIAHPRCAALLEQIAMERQVELHLGRTLQGVEEGKGTALFSFQDGWKIEADLCIVGIGIQPRTEFIDRAQVRVDKGILVDHRMRSTAEDLYAAGDVSQGTNLLTGRKEVFGLWGSACYQGRTAGYNMASREVSYRGAVPDHVGSVFGVDFVHLGDIRPGGQGRLVISDKEFSEEGYRLLCFEKGVLKGVNLLNDSRYAGPLSRAIRRKYDWSADLEKLMPHPEPSALNGILGKWALRG